jgi:hypothetical protein
MGRKIEDLLLNPFAKRVVERPRGIDVTVPGLNAKILHELQKEFAALLQGSPPRARLRKDEVQLVMSADPGYGKSHLIGRLFEELKQSATRIYVRPFTDPSNAWSSTLSRLVLEMSLPEDGGADALPNGEPTQMDAFGQAVLAQAFLELVRRNPELEPENPVVLTRMGGLPLDAFDLGNASTPEARWMDCLTEDELDQAACLLPALGVSLQPGSSAETWLRVLFLYIADRTQVQRRSLCLEWVEAKLHRSDVGELGLSQRAGLDDDVDRSGRNDEARARTLDLCALAGLFRPFLICFDQTETYGQRPELARAFGNLVADLFQEAPNQMTLVTANEDKWKRDIRPHVDDAHIERFGWPRYLEEITQEQSTELARRRLEFCGVAESEVQRFIDPAWLQQVVPAGGVSVRRFLEEAAHRFATLSQQHEGSEGLADLLKSEKLELTGRARKLRLYQGDLYRWALLDVPRSTQPGFKAASFESRRDYFPIAWNEEDSGRSILFGFEERENHRSWEAIAKEARRKGEQHQGHLAVIMIRLETQPLIPLGNWAIAPLIREVLEENLQIERLSEERLLTMHALWELYSASCQGNIAAVPEEVLRLAAQHLAPWWADLREVAKKACARRIAPPATAAAADAALSQLVEAIIRERRFIGEEDLALEVRARSGKVVAATELHALCQQLGSRVRTQTGEGTKAYLWQG